MALFRAGMSYGLPFQRQWMGILPYRLVCLKTWFLELVMLFWNFGEWGLAGGIGSLIVGFEGYDPPCLLPESSAF